MDTSITHRRLGDPAFKASMRAQWDAAAPGWDAHTADIHRWLQPATDAMCRLAGVRAGAQVLDVAAGAGDQTLTLAQRVGAQGRVLATDLSPALVALTRHNAGRAGLRQVQARVADGEHLAEDLGDAGAGGGAGFDAVVCRLGLMFFPDPLQGLRGMHRMLRPGGGLGTVVFAGPAHNPGVALLMATALRYAGLPMPDPATPGGLFSLGAPGRLDALCHDAGFVDVVTTALDAPFHLPSAEHYLAFVRSSASPVLQILARLAPAAAEAAWQDLRERLQVFNTADGWAGPNTLLLTAARRAGTAP